ncbi:hypothetical protein [Tranquillimonas alkanivorans]|uniref:Uncharacterized protein n=1 Tax=Tranquillimonas alkanivorans TaxID=441119 RepID=A0A1I5VZT4_9RHOB|nr:hypothetical protein [Tranquillimonas alkanivorans]SFQ13034.1 hypothetical protein SAMN04488047_13810 [Tranquillimonas alkanivorans]
MNAYTTFPATAVADPLAPVRGFVSAHRDALWHAARLLGGYDAARLVENMADRLAHEATPSRALRRELHALRKLLHLENVHDPEHVEAAAFAVLSPEDPAIEEICLLTDGFDEALAAWEALEAEAQAPRHAA